MRARPVLLAATVAAGLALSHVAIVDAQGTPPSDKGDSAESTQAEARLRALSRILMRQSRNLATLETEQGEVLVHCGKLKADGDDYRSLETLATGEVQTITRAAAAKLRTEVDLLFGDLRVPAGNVADGFAGIYGLWLKRADDGWRLLLNDEADVWGTQRDPGADAGEIPLTHETLSDVAEEMVVELEETEEGGVLVFRWGAHHWSAPFRVAPTP